MDTDKKEMSWFLHLAKRKKMSTNYPQSFEWTFFKITWEQESKSPQQVIPHAESSPIYQGPVAFTTIGEKEKLIS